MRIKHKPHLAVWTSFWDYREVWDSLDACRGQKEQTEGTISLLPIEQLPWLTQINLTWLLRCRKKIPNKIQHCWNLMPAHYTHSWVICSIQTLPPPESHPCKGRLIRISERKNILFILTALGGTWCKTPGLSPYLAGKFPTSLCKTTLWAYVNSFSITALGLLSGPCLNRAIMPPHHFILKVAEPCGVQAKTCGVLLRQLSET